MERPDKLPEWASHSNALVEEPNEEKKKIGWIHEKANFSFLNYWQNKVYKWIKYLDEKQVVFPPDIFQSDFSLPWTRVKGVGFKDQIAAGHILTSASFPLIPHANLSFYNFSNHLDQSVNKRDFINVGGLFNGKGIFEDPTLCLYENKYLVSQDPFFKPSKDFVFGFWLTPLANSGVILSQREMFNLTYEEGTLVLNASENGVDYKKFSVRRISSWCHIVVQYVAKAKRFTVFINGSLYTTFYLEEDLYVTSSPFFMLGDRSKALRGYYDEFFFMQAVLEYEDIKKLFSAKIEHYKGYAPENQLWSLWEKSERGNVRPILDYPIWGINENNIYLNFFDENSNTEIALKMKLYR